MLGALTEQAVGGEHLSYSCAFAAGGSAGLLGLVTGGVARIPAVQRAALRWAGRLGQMLGESRVGQWAKAAAGQLAVAARRVRATGVPQGLTRAQFRELSASVRAKSLEMDYGHDIVVRGSRAAGRARPTLDIDLGIRVSPERFDELITQRFGAPNPGSAREATMLHAAAVGKITARHAGLSRFRDEAAERLGMKIDLSVIRSGGPFDGTPNTPLLRP